MEPGQIWESSCLVWDLFPTVKRSQMYFSLVICSFLFKVLRRDNELYYYCLIIRIAPVSNHATYTRVTCKFLLTVTLQGIVTADLKRSTSWLQSTYPIRLQKHSLIVSTFLKCGLCAMSIQWSLWTAGTLNPNVTQCLQKAFMPTHLIVWTVFCSGTNH